MERAVVNTAGKAYWRREDNKRMKGNSFSLRLKKARRGRPKKIASFFR